MVGMSLEGTMSAFNHISKKEANSAARRKCLVTGPPYSDRVTQSQSTSDKWTSGAALDLGQSYRAMSD